MAAKLNDFQEKWLQALESGKWKQGKGRLHFEGKFCCLGVAATLYGFTPDILGKQTDLSEDLAPVMGALCLYDDEGNHRSFLRTFGEPSNCRGLTNLNDGLSGPAKTFSEIAAIIRAAPGAYFSNCAEESE